MAERMLKIGHRGAMGYAPENTLAAFDKALQLGVDMIEFDIHVCGSGEVVIIHDRRVDRTTNGQGLVSALSLKQLKKLDAGQGQQIPTLMEALDFIDRRAQVNIEIIAAEAVKPLSKIIEQYLTQGWRPEDFLVSSFDHEALKRFHKKQPLIRLGMLIHGIPLNVVRAARKLKAYSVHPSIRYLSSRLVRKIQKHGYRVFVYGNNSHDDIDTLKQMGVDGIFADCPDWI